ncbi:hypothetical protein DFH08DRAFT_803205 [Mycena albidolilacea]|uniref:Uncharacterized protein n=1 Tax=Mycena albidolilacea TaxID=1033008 RepID=A0AAD7AC64_9AGAR|nr:hypothetical protein DFH08DRAFT_803205 [Mycena albidolilacea]
MHLVRSLWPVTLCIAAVRGGFTNFTLDDTSPTITYTETPTARCSPGACDPGLTSRLHNGMSTITAGTIIVPFTGSAAYVYLGTLGDCIFNLDGNNVSTFSRPDGSHADDIFLAWTNTTMSDELHVLTISPQNVDWFIQLDYMIYRCFMDGVSYGHLARNHGGDSTGAEAVFSCLPISLGRWLSFSSLPPGVLLLYTAASSNDYD